MPSFISCYFFPKENQLVQSLYKPLSPVAKTYMSDNSIDENTLVKGFKCGSRPYVFNPKYCSSTTLPLYFYYGYQIWQGLEKKEKCGQVSHTFSLMLINILDCQVFGTYIRMLSSFLKFIKCSHTKIQFKAIPT